VSAYWAIVSARFRVLLQYRAAAVAGFGTQLFWGLIRVMIFSAFFASTRSPQPMSREEVLTYVWLGQAMFALLSLGIDSDIQAMMRSGTVVYELLKPVDVYWVWFCRSAALRFVPTVMRGVPVMIVAGLFFQLRLPPSPASALACAAALFGALILASAMTTIMSVSLIWTISGLGVTRILPALIYTLSGIIIPIPFFPDWAQPVLHVLPFRHIVDTPFRLYLGHIPAGQAIPLLVQEAVWAAGLIMLGRWLLARGARRLVAQGG